MTLILFELDWKQLPLGQLLAHLITGLTYVFQPVTLIDILAGL